MDPLYIVSGLCLLLFALVFYLLLKPKSGPDLGVYRDIIQDLEKDRDVLKAEIGALKVKTKDLENVKSPKEEEIINLRRMLLLIESAYRGMPLPQWIKDENGVMISLNDAYEQMFLLPQGKSRLDYIQHRDSDIWPEEVAKKYGENDDQIIKKKLRLWIGKEPIWVANSDISKNWIIGKFGIYDSKGKILGVGGIAMPEVNTDTAEISRMFVDFMIQQGDIFRALEALAGIAQEEEKGSVLILQGALSRLRKAESLGVSDKYENEKERRKITQSLLSILQRLDDH